MPTDLLLLLSGVAAGAFGALLGLGGGILIVPILTLGFGLPLSAAVGTSLVSSRHQLLLVWRLRELVPSPDPTQPGRSRFQVSTTAALASIP